ncbi:hypothetical protein D3C87_97550 [compost metagenome]
MLKSHLFLILLVVSGFNGFAQQIVPGTSFTQFSLKSKKDTIDFVITGTDLTVKKPVFLFIQGSMPIPLFVSFPGQDPFPMALGNFDLQNMHKHFHVVTISMPKTPVLLDFSQVNSNYCYIPDTTRKNEISDAFVMADHIDNYVDRANKVLDFLSKQKWVDNSRLVVSGHSQGSRIVAQLVEKNRKITHAGLFGFSPLGRVHEQVWLNYKEFIQGNSSWEDYEAKQNQQLEFQKLISADKGEDIGLIPWKSFTGIGFERLSKIKTPLYIAYGTEDKCAFVSELIPLYFIEAGKTNYEMKRYNGLEHNYFPVVDGKPDYDNGKWAEVMNEFVAWSLKE